jgi:hypothetical protein
MLSPVLGTRDIEVCELAPHSTLGSVLLPSGYSRLTVPLPLLGLADEVIE